MKFFLHHSAVSYNSNPDQLKSIDDNHHQRFNMKSSLGFWVGYTFVINKAGALTKTREIGEEQAAQIGFNKDSISVCLEMDGDKELPTPEQENALVGLIARILATYDISPFDFLFHRDVASYKSCPGNLITREWYNEIVHKAFRNAIINH